MFVVGTVKVAFAGTVVARMAVAVGGRRDWKRGVVQLRAVVSGRTTNNAVNFMMETDEQDQVSSNSHQNQNILLGSL